MSEENPQSHSHQTISTPINSHSIHGFISENFENGENEFIIPSGIAKESKDIRLRLDETRIMDNTIRIILRVLFCIFFAALLIYQNYMVFGLVINSMVMGSLKDLQLIFSILVAATLLETYKISDIMVKWVFKDIDYK